MHVAATSPTTRPAPVVRAAVPADADAVAAVTLAAYEPFGWRPGDPYHATLADAAGRVRDGRVLVAEVDDRLVGAVAVALADEAMFEHDPRDGDGGFRMLAVDPAARRAGVGRALTVASLDLLRTLGARRAVITTMEQMTAAQAMYAGMGFVRRADLDVRYPRGRGLAMTIDLVEDIPVDAFRAPGPVPAEPPWYADVQPDPSSGCA